MAGAHSGRTPAGATDAWRVALSGFVAPTPIPFDAGAGVASSGRVVVRRELDGALGDGLRSAGERLGLSPTEIVEAVWAVVLSRANAESDVLFGVRGQGPTNGVPAPSDHVVPLRADVSPGARFSAFAAALHERARPLRAGPLSPLEIRAVSDVEPLLPLFDSAIFCSAGPDAGEAPLFDGAVGISVRVDRGVSLSASGDPARFEPWALDHLLEQLGLALAHVAASPDVEVAEVRLLSAAGENELVVDWNARADDGSRGECVHTLFEAVARANPGAIAVVSDDGALTYGELDLRSNALARHLQAQGVGPGDCVALCLTRSPGLIVALLAILKAGGAYLPLEPTYPRSRLAFMMGDAAPKAVLTEQRLRGLLPDVTPPIVEIDTDASAIAAAGSAPVAASVGPEGRAYVIYTSGSTGVPKGVEVPHGAIERLVRDVDYVRLGPEQTILQAAPVAFDASTFEIWGALLNGGRVALHAEPVPTAKGLRAAIARHGVTTMWLTAALFNAVMDEDPSALSSLGQLLTGGEALSVPHVRLALEALPNTALINGYGPTETTTFATCFRIEGPLDPRATSIPIGRAIRATRLYVLDGERRPVPLGSVGELYIGGRGVALGYLGRPELTAERFSSDPFRPGERMYRTGDLVRLLPGAVVQYIGRADQQVKVRGFRIELGEIEARLAKLPGVKSSVVAARPGIGVEKRLVAYAVLRDGAAQPTTSELREKLGAELPEYMIPSAFVWLPELPVTLNGKIDYRALPDPGADRPELAVEYVAPRSPLEETLVATWAELLGLSKVGVLDNFFDLGASSLLVVKAVARLEQAHGLRVRVLDVFEHPTVAGLGGLLAGGAKSDGLAQRLRSFSERRASLERPGIAIVGMAGRFPGARTVEELWKNLCSGQESISFFSDAELDPNLPGAVVADPAYVKARGIVEGVELFDAAFFGITPKEAVLMDPQQRLLLEVAWETLESAGHVPDTYPGTIGIFAGKYNDSYYAENVVTHPELIDEIGVFQTMVANEKDYIATRIAHRLNLRGPALSIHTACSTSLVAVVQAVQNLLLGQCDMALAGGVSITVPVKSGYLYQEGAMLSVDGHTRSFDARAQGTVFSDGAAMVLLKRLPDALADGDTIYGVIRGAALNNDGGGKASFTAPSVEGQAAVVAAAQAEAGVDPQDITYVEAHGTATPLGDPIEVEALTRAFRLHTNRRAYCALGSIKSNVGHMVTAAGAAGLIKTALSLTHRVIVPTVHFERPNPKIDFEGSPFFVAKELRPWVVEGKARIAGVSSFGVGGTNAHVVVEEPPALFSAPAERTTELLLLSARSEAALGRASERLAEYLDAHPDVPLADVAFTLHAGRKAFPHRRAITANDAREAARVLRSAEPKQSASRKAPGNAGGIAFLFPGQGAQYAGMGGTLYREHPVFRAHVNACAEVLTPVLGRDLRDLVFPKPGGEAAAAEALRQTEITQPALFVVSYATAMLWSSFGVEPKAMIGHSVGEFVCAALSGVLAFEDALALVAARGRMMQEMPSGSMLSVRLPAVDLEKLIGSDVEIASDNGPSLSVVAGPTEAVEALQRRLEAGGTVCRLLQTSHAFHSRMMDPVVERFEQLMRRVRLSAPRTPFVSTATGTWIRPEEARDPAYWARHLRLRVRFREGVATLWSEPGLTLLEVGPRATLATLARQQITDRKKQTCVASLGDSDEDAWHTTLGAAGQLWLLGTELDARGLHGPEQRRRMALPTYPFEQQRFWVEPAPGRGPGTSATTRAAVPAAPSPAFPSPVLAPAPVSLVASSPEGATLPSAISPLPEVSMPSTDTSTRRSQLIGTLLEALEEASGLEISSDDAATPFMELGLDSLFLTQFALSLQRKFKIKITFRQLLENYPTMDTLAAHVESTLPPEVGASSAAAPTPPPAATVTPASPAVATAPVPPVAPAFVAMPALSAPSASAGTVQYVIDQQLRIMAQQLALLGGGAPAATAEPRVAQLAAPAPSPAASAPVAAGPLPAKVANPPAASASAPAAGSDDEPTGPMKYDVKKAFGAIARITVAKTEELTAQQKAKLEAFVRRYNAKTRGSKQFAQDNRRHMADPRVVTGFRPAVKELVYPIVAQRSAGSKLWDLDGNEYVDALNGFGLNLFGWQPEFVTKAIEEQLRSGHEIGPQHPLTGEVARLICELTGFDRAAFCNTGSEAVMGCTRIARTVTGRSKIAIFSGSYHGIFDEVVVRGTKKLRSIPAAPGIMPSTAENVLVLDYGTDESLEILKSRADELAAIIVEPVQSRRPDFQPREFLHALRDLTTRAGIVYIFDEVVTGFRKGPGGAQEFFGVKADLASYGKVLGGGLPIGVIAGKEQYMDALDGGFWQFGDDSMPTVGVTYFAGTFVRHPLALAAAKAVLTHLKERGPSLQRDLNDRTAAFVQDLNTFFGEVSAPIKIKHFASLWKTFYTEDQAFGDLLFYMMRDRGVHIFDGFPCFFTTAHSEADFAHIAKAYKDSVLEMQDAGFLPGRRPTTKAAVFDASAPPAQGAKLGRDPEGNPAWYTPHPSQPGRYVKYEPS